MTLYKKKGRTLKVLNTLPTMGKVKVLQDIVLLDGKTNIEKGSVIKVKDLNRAQRRAFNSKKTNLQVRHTFLSSLMHRS